jgi:cytochrome b involved in lipid metabolism
LTDDEFNALVAKGRKLVILDNLVLDVEQFLIRHPGGCFTIRHNIGKDISKFFNGGYSLDGNLVVNLRGHKHTNLARMIVNELVIARYGDQKPIDMICKKVEIGSNRINSSTVYFRFKAKSQETKIP